METPFKEITLTRVYDAPRERVWRALTDPQEVAIWWGPRGVTAPESRLDLRVGGEIYIVMLAGPELGPMAGQRWPMRGTFTEIKEPEKLVYVNRAMDEATDTVMLEGLTTTTLDDASGKTKLTVVTNAKGLVPQAPQMLEGMEMGWSQQLDKLGEYLAK